MHTTGERWRLGRRPALDGLRGVAVLLVVLSHAAGPHLAWAGATGVTVFFTLSGFLITALCLAEVDRTGHLDLWAFWGRRARRLLPALLSMVACVAVAGVVLGGWFVQPMDIVAALTYWQNWADIAHGPHGALAHTWSLAVEEHFYLLWPLVVVLLRKRRRALLAVAVAGACASFLVRLAVWDGGAGAYRAMFGSDARADALLVGCILAIVMARSTEGRARPGLAVSGLLLLLGFAVGLSVTAGGGVVLGPLVTAVLSALVIWATARGVYRGVLMVGPLQWVGRRSYGIYLWHFPMTAVLGVVFLNEWLPQLLILVPASLVVAAVSWRYIEEPFLRRRQPIASTESLTNATLAVPEDRAHFAVNVVVPGERPVKSLVNVVPEYEPLVTK